MDAALTPIQTWAKAFIERRGTNKMLALVALCTLATQAKERAGAGSTARQAWANSMGMLSHELDIDATDVTQFMDLMAQAEKFGEGVDGLADLIIDAASRGV